MRLASPWFMGFGGSLETYRWRDTGGTIIISMNAKKVEAARRILGENGLAVDSVMHMGKEWFQIDFRERVAPRYGGSGITVSFGPYGLATPEEMEELADGVYTPGELKELFLKRQAEKQGVDLEASPSILVATARLRDDGMVIFSLERASIQDQPLRQDELHKLRETLGCNGASSENIEKFVSSLLATGLAIIRQPILPTKFFC